MSTLTPTERMQAALDATTQRLSLAYTPERETFATEMLVTLLSHLTYTADQKRMTTDELARRVEDSLGYAAGNEKRRAGRLRSLDLGPTTADLLAAALLLETADTGTDGVA